MADQLGGGAAGPIYLGFLFVPFTAPFLTVGPLTTSFLLSVRLSDFLASGDGDGLAVGPDADSMGPLAVVAEGVATGFVTTALFVVPEQAVDTATLATRIVDFSNDLLIVLFSMFPVTAQRAFLNCHLA